MKTADFDFTLPEELIAKEPLEERDTSRLLVLKEDGSLEDRFFRELPDLLSPGDLLIINNTRVIPARLLGRKPTGGKLDILIVKKVGKDIFDVLTRGRYSGRVLFPDGTEGELIEGSMLIIKAPDPEQFVWRHGLMPLPPYIKRLPDERDRRWYQTVFSKKTGSIAAPTAGLHFSEPLLNSLKDKGVVIKEITLHVGIGTFKPVRAENLREHHMDSEEFEIQTSLIDLINEKKEAGKRVIGVGTTVTRTLEAVFSGRYSETYNSRNGVLRGETDLFIYPGYSFKAITSLITNFHLPRSTPLMLVSAFVGREKILQCYSHAMEKRYRFFSYGDAMLIL
ncbi:MAG: tRNA preQ1(34) S-adenosylmethionine ribosyltransferase-isomerase QueA [Nitrospirae bacterium]|nr:MAG: tRNA preQ1(34) S-adenosylmethionine ribosyltransferase-isomerase QueA [Nitrospirota bacterium]